MVDINVHTKPARRRVEVRTGIIRRRHWTDEEKGRIVAEAIARDVTIAKVARRYGLTPQHLSNWIRAAKDGRFALPAEGVETSEADCSLVRTDEAAFVPVIAVEPEKEGSAAPR
jgi:transposase-like protein